MQIASSGAKVQLLSSQSRPTVIHVTYQRFEILATEYSTTLIELRVAAGVFAASFVAFPRMLKVAVPTLARPVQ
jgi:hypothetical protein